MTGLVVIAVICWFGKMAYDIVTQGLAETKVKSWVKDQIKENEKFRERNGGK